MSAYRTVTALVGCVSLATALPAQTGSLSAADWRADLAYLFATLRAVHPAPFHYASEQRFDSAIKALDRDIPRLAPRQIALRMMGIVSLAQDGHTQLQPARPIFSRDRSFPVRIERFVDGIYLVAVRPDDRAILGARVAKIGGRDAALVWDSVAAIAAGDNVFSKMEGAAMRLTMPEIMAGLGLADSTALQLDLMLPSGSATKRTVSAVSVTDDVRWSQGGADGPGGATVSLPEGDPANVDLPFRHRSLPYWFAIEGTTLYARINQVLDSRDTVVLNGLRGVVTLGGFAQRLMAQVDSGKVDRLVIDLRHNGGGNNDLARPIVASIAARSAINRKGGLFVITGRRTYSAAMNFTSLFEHQTEAIFVGEPPGGAPSHYGDNTGFVLPHSKLTLRVSTLHWDLGVRPTDVRTVMEPDLPAPPRFSELVRGTDGALDAVRRYVPNAILSDRLLQQHQDSGFDAAIRLYRTVRASDALPPPWSSDVQQLIAFAYGTIPRGTRADIFRVFGFVTDVYPDAHQAWMDRARVYGFVGDWEDARRAFAKALALRPQNDFTRRMYESASRR